MIHKKGKENSNADALSRLSHMPEAPPLSKNEYEEFYEMDEPVIQFAEGVNRIQQVQSSMIEVAEKQAKDKVWREVISWVEQGCVPGKKETRGKAREVLVALSMFHPEVYQSEYQSKCWPGTSVLNFRDQMGTG